MDDVLLTLKTPEACENYEKMLMKQDRPDLAAGARKRAVELRALEKGAKNDVERECLEAIYAYEQVLSRTRGRKTPASRTWQMINRYGIVSTVERVVNRKDDPSGYVTLVELGLQDYSFEAVVLRYPTFFHRERFSDLRNASSS